jgi:diguanylate cyclase (GGDEF)-like protein
MFEPSRLRLTWLAAATLIAAVPLLIPVLALHDPRMLMFPYVAVLDTLAAVVCVRLACRRSSLLRLQWILFAAHFVLRSVSVWIPTLRVWTGWPGSSGTSWIVSWSSALSTMLCLLVFTAAGRQVRRLKRGVDVCLTAILCGLHFLAVFSTDASGFTGHYLQMSFAVAVFLVLVAQASYVGATTTGEQNFTQIARVYLLARVVLLFFNSIVNYTWLPTPRELPFDLLFGVPQLAFLLMVFWYPPTTQIHRPLRTPRLVIQTLLPSMILLGVIALALTVFREHMYLADCAMLLAVILFIVRTHLLYQRMLREQQRLLKRAGYLEALASRDALTGIGNRRWLEEMADDLLVKSIPNALLLVDTDQFKSINDTFGHQAGDDLLKMIAEVMLKETEVVEDCVCVRLGGDEFVALLPGTRMHQAVEIAQQVRKRIEAVSTQFGHQTTTVSVGVAAGSGQVTLPNLLQLADEALYRAKSEGRNIVEISSEDATSFQSRRERPDGRRFRKDRIADASAVAQNQ